MKKIMSVLLAIFLPMHVFPMQDDNAYSEKDAWFVDGYHGGVYGHYPVEWYTRFIVDCMSQNEDWKICLEIEPETWDTVRLRTPADYREFAALVQGGRVEFTNPTYAQPYLYNIGSESVIRQFDYGMRKLRSHFPTARVITYSAEEPCFTSCLPQVLKGFGFKYASLKCPDTCWGGYTAAYGGELVNWVSSDGSSVIAVPRYACEELKDGTTWQTIAFDNSQYYLDRCFKAGIEHPVGMCFQDAGWKNGPWLGLGGKAAKRSVYTLWTDYIEHVASAKSSDDYFFTQEDVKPGLMWGTQVLQKIAQSVRRTENKISQTEKIAAMAYVERGFGPDNAVMDEAWRMLMLSQHHDSWIVPYNNLNSRGTWADNIRLWTSVSDSLAGSVLGKALLSFAADSAAGQEKTLTLFNTLGVSRREIVGVRLPTGRMAMLEADVPPFGYATYSPDKLHEVEDEKTVIADDDSCVIENDMYRIVVNLTKGGAFSSLLHKPTGDEYVARCDSMPFNTLRGYFPEKGRFESSADTRATAEVLADNSYMKCVRIKGSLDGTPVMQTIAIRSGQRLIDCSLQVGWTENRMIGDIRHRSKEDKTAPFYDTRRMLNLSFPVDAGISKIYKDAPFDVCESRLGNTFYNRWDSIKHNVVLSWFDITCDTGLGMAVFTDHTTTYSHGSGFPPSLTVQYSGPGLWWRDYPVSGATSMRYAIVPHRGRWDEACIDTESRRWNEPLVSAMTCLPDDCRHSLVNVDDTGCDVSAFYVDERGLTLRLYNSFGDNGYKTVKLGFKAEKIAETDLSGNILDIVSRGGSEFKVAMPRFGFKTFKISL